MKARASILAFLISCCAAAQAPPARDHHIRDAAFPLIQGSRWTYAGTVRWTPAGSDQVFEKSMRWQMEIVETIDRRSVVAARIKGHPLDLAWYEEGREPREYLIVQVWGQRYYLLQGGRAAQALQALRSRQGPFVDLVTEGELFLELPLVANRAFGATSQLTREDQFYCWIVGVPREDRLEALKRDTREPVLVWEVSERTIGSLQSYEFAPGIGFTRYRYRHHGTVSEFDVRLVEYHKGP
jgi:hypothetical protein